MPTKSFAKARILLDLLESHCQGNANLETLHILSGYPKATVKRLLDDLQELGIIYRRLGDKRYVLLSMDQESYDPTCVLAKDLSPVLEQLHQDSGLFSDVVIIRQEQASIIESNLSLSRLRTASEMVIGANPSLRDSAAGRTLCAESSTCDELDKIHDQWSDTLRQEQNQGVYARVEGTWEYGFDQPFYLQAVAMPVRYKGKTLAALSLYWNGKQYQNAGRSPDKLRMLANARDKMETIFEDRAGMYRRLALELPFD